MQFTNSSANGGLVNYCVDVGLLLTSVYLGCCSSISKKEHWKQANWKKITGLFQIDRPSPCYWGRSSRTNCRLSSAAMA